MKETPQRIILFSLLTMLATSFGQLSRAAVVLTNGPMLTARYNHTATLLSNGKVLVAGGWNGSYLSSAELYDPATGHWTSTGSMTTNRCFHTATLLRNGKVLVTGGYCNASPSYLSTAEVYDPSTGTWAATGPMNGAHVYHTATLLQNGKVLVAGGVDPGGWNQVSELYDPATGLWTKSGTMQRPRWYHTSTLLTNGMVLAAEGDADDLPTAELYDPTVGTWTSTSSMTTNRLSPTATLLPNGQVLVAGGWLTYELQTNPPAYTSASLSSAELFDPTTGNWTPTTNQMTIPRNSQAASLLPNGQVLLIGGFLNNSSGSLASMELFDSTAEAWVPITNTLNSARYNHTATLLPGGKVLIAGGINSEFGGGVTNLTETFDNAANIWSNTSSMSTNRIDHTMTMLPTGKILVVGGAGDGGSTPLPTAELYDATSGTWTNTGSLNVARYDHTATLLASGMVLVAGGATSAGQLASAELFDPVSQTWTPTGSLNFARNGHTASLLHNGKVLVAGGHNDSVSLDNGFIPNAELYNPDIGTWAQTGSLNIPRWNNTATILCDGRVLVAGGTDQNGAYLSSAELYNPATGVWTSTADLLTARAFHTATLLPDGRVLVAGGENNPYIFLTEAELFDPVTETWQVTGSMTSARSGPTATSLCDGKVLVIGGLENDFVDFGGEVFDPASGTWTMTAPMEVTDNDAKSILLADGRVLVTGGIHGSTIVSTAELFDEGLDFADSFRPQIASVTSPLDLGGVASVAGNQFRGIAEASSGDTQDSSTDYPLVQLRSIESGQSAFLLCTNWSTNSFISTPVWHLPPGYALATVFVNGIQSTSSVISINVPIPTPPTLINPGLSPNGSFQCAFTNTVGTSFGARATTNISLPLTNWTAIGGVLEIAPGQFQFTDPQVTNNPQRFYRISSF